MPRPLSVLSLVPALFAAWAGVPSVPSLQSLASLPGVHLPAWVERWLYNPRERTGQAMEAIRQGKAKEALGPADTALRLAPGDPLVRYDDGTAHLQAGDRQGAVPLLEKAAKAADPALAPAAWYNLGNAQLGAGNAAAAVEAYKEALRRAPHDADAKHNLEIALRQRDEEQRRFKSPREGSRGDREGEKGSSSQAGANDPSKDPNPSPASDPGQGGDKKEDAPKSSDGRLPRFHDQPEMNAQEAASLLQSVENLERQHRRQQASQRARQQAAKGKDW
jgi:tetratricopeptide (TPR) repeat protein